MTEYDTIEESRDGEKPWRDADLMRELYHDKLMSQDEIASHFDGKITQAGVGYCLDQLGIEKRDRSEAAKTRWEKLTMARDYNIKDTVEQNYRTIADGEEAEINGYPVVKIAEGPSGLVMVDVFLDDQGDIWLATDGTRRISGEIEEGLAFKSPDHLRRLADEIESALDR